MTDGLTWGEITCWKPLPGRSIPISLELALFIYARIYRPQSKWKREHSRSKEFLKNTTSSIFVEEIEHTGIISSYISG